MSWLSKTADSLEKLSVEKRLSILEQQVKDIIIVVDKIANYLNDKEIDRN